MSWKMIAIGLIFIGLLFPQNNIAQTSGLNSVEINETINISNTEKLDIEFLSMETYEGPISSDGTLYKVETTSKLSILQFNWNLTGLTTNYAELFGEDATFGDTFFIKDGEASRLALESRIATTGMYFENKLVFSEGIHTLSFVYMSTDVNNGLVYDIETINLEVRQSGVPFGSNFKQVDLNLSLTDIHEPNTWDVPLVVDSDPGYSMAGSNRSVADGSTILYTDYSETTNILSVIANVNSSGTLDFQNSTGSQMTQGNVFIFDAHGIRSVTDSPIYFYDEFPYVSLIVQRDAGFNTLFSNYVDQYVKDWEGIATEDIQLSYDAILEDNLFSVEGGIDYIIPSSNDTVDDENTNDTGSPRIPVLISPVIAGLIIISIVRRYKL